MQAQEYYTQEDLQELLHVTYDKIKEAVDKLTASGEIVVETRNIDRRKKFIHRRYLPKFRAYFGLDS
jgi:DNA-binding MarR family transcriptional regulator